MTNASGGSLDVIVADDEEDARALLECAVLSCGHRCRIAVDGLDALRLLAERPADVVVSDWDMPRMDGAELCRRIRSGGDEAAYTYFMLVTAFDDRAHLLEGMAAGADDYQRKPVNLHELEARLVTAVRVVELHRRLELRTDALTGAGNRSDGRAPEGWSSSAQSERAFGALFSCWRAGVDSDDEASAFP